MIFYKCIKGTLNFKQKKLNTWACLIPLLFRFKGKTFHWPQGKYIVWALFHQTRVNFLMHICYKYSMSTATLRATQLCTNLQVVLQVPWCSSLVSQFWSNDVCIGLHRQETLGNLFWKKPTLYLCTFSEK